MPGPGPPADHTRLTATDQRPLVGLLPTFDRKRGVGGELGRIATEEVVVRPAEVFVRPLAHEEAVRLKRLAKRAKHQSTRQRAAMLLGSNAGLTAPQIASSWLTDPSFVRKVIHEFNERGFASLDPDYRGGRPRRITVEDRKRIVAVAGARPDRQGVPLTRWSLPRLAVHLAEHGLVIVSPAHLGRILATAGLSFQRTRSWKASPDPDYQAKAARVLELVSAPPGDGGVVISFDQMGPVSLRPTHGSGWAPQGRPERHRATYRRLLGTRYVFGAYDVHADRLRVRLRPRRRGSDNLAFMAQIRASYPRRRRIYWIQDNLSANWTPDIRQFAADNRIEPVAIPTYASYLNPVECHFGAITEFVVNNADYLDWDAFAWALARHVTYRNGPHRDRRLVVAENRHRITLAA
jgi:transposase